MGILQFQEEEEEDQQQLKQTKRFDKLKSILLVTSVEKPLESSFLDFRSLLMLLVPLQLLDNLPPTPPPEEEGEGEPQLQIPHQHPPLPSPVPHPQVHRPPPQPPQSTLVFPPQSSIQAQASTIHSLDSHFQNYLYLLQEKQDCSVIPRRRRRVMLGWLMVLC